MRLDHIVFAATPKGLAYTADCLSEKLGEKFQDGGVHPRFGTRNAVLPLAGGTYVEVVEVLDHPASDKAVFGQAVRARTELGGGWMGWVVAVPDISPVEARIGRESIHGNRHRPDGIELNWKQLGLKGLQSDPQLPYFIEWESGADVHPSVGATGEIALQSLEIAGDPDRVTEWLGEPKDHPLDDIDVEWVAPNGTPGIVAASFTTPAGTVRL